MKIILFLIFSCLVSAQTFRWGNGKIGNYEWNGLYIQAAAADTFYYGDLCYYNSENSDFRLLYPDSISHFNTIVGMVVNDTLPESEQGTFLIQGFVKNTEWTYSVGQEIFADTGDVADAAPVASDKIADKIGFAPQPTILYIDPNSPSYYWEDLRFPVSAVTLPMSLPATETDYVGGLVLDFPTSADAIIRFTAQLPHTWVEETDLYVNIEYALESNASADDSVTWVFTYSWFDIDSNITEPSTITITEDLTGKVDSTYYEFALGSLEGTGKTLSSTIICSLKRDVSEDNYGAGVYLIAIDIHYQTDGRGSRLRYTK